MNIQINILGINNDRTELRILNNPTKTDVENAVLSLLNMLGNTAHAIIGMNKKMYAAYHKMKKGEYESTSYVITPINYHPYMQRVLEN